MRKNRHLADDVSDPSLDARWLLRRERFYEHGLAPMRQPAVYHFDDDHDPHIDVYALARTPQRPFETLITGGLADRPQPGVRAGEGFPRRVELLLRTPAAEEWAVLILREIASLPFAFDLRLAPGVIIRGSRAVRPGSTLCHGLLGPAGEPGLDGFTVDGEPVAFLLLELVTEAELVRGVREGGLALLAALREHKVDPVVDLHRASIF
ncbi:MAG: suppressor of fused domain protein [Planctomycetes bacterium]|jgi:hypothetical protein|nr:suppressor of fused domain protein [Planctomycetota bacterium]